MNHKRLSRFLIFAGALAGCGGAAVFFAYAPMAGRHIVMLTPALAYLFWPMLLYIWVIAGLYAAALALYIKICLRVGENQSFCQENARGMALIGLCLYGAAGLWGALAAACLLIPAVQSAVWLVFLLVGVASFCVGVVARVLGYLVRRAAQLQEDSDLTV